MADHFCVTAIAFLNPAKQKNGVVYSRFVVSTCSGAIFEVKVISNKLLTTVPPPHEVVRLETTVPHSHVQIPLRV